MVLKMNQYGFYYQIVGSKYWSLVNLPKCAVHRKISENIIMAPLRKMEDGFF